MQAGIPEHLQALTAPSATAPYFPAHSHIFPDQLSCPSWKKSFARSTKSSAIPPCSLVTASPTTYLAVPREPNSPAHLPGHLLKQKTPKLFLVFSLSFPSLFHNDPELDFCSMPGLTSCTLLLDFLSIKVLKKL